MNPGFVMKRRNLIVMMLLTIFIPFYKLYWWCSVQNQLHKKTGRGVSGFVHFLLTFFTFGIWPLVWYFLVTGWIGAAGGRNRRFWLGLIFIIGMILGWVFLGIGMTATLVPLITGVIEFIREGSYGDFEFTATGAWAILGTLASLAGSALTLLPVYINQILIQKDVNNTN